MSIKVLDIIRPKNAFGDLIDSQDSLTAEPRTGSYIEPSVRVEEHGGNNLTVPLGHASPRSVGGGSTTNPLSATPIPGFSGLQEGPSDVWFDAISPLRLPSYTPSCQLADLDVRSVKPLRLDDFEEIRERIGDIVRQRQGVGSTWWDPESPLREPTYKPSYQFEDPDVRPIKSLESVSTKEIKKRIVDAVHKTLGKSTLGVDVEVEGAEPYRVQYLGGCQRYEYLQCHKDCGLQIGDTVKLLRRPGNEGGWQLPFDLRFDWYGQSTRCIKRVGRITDIAKDHWVVTFPLPEAMATVEDLVVTLFLPYFVLEKTDLPLPSAESMRIQDVRGKIYNHIDDTWRWL